MLIKSTYLKKARLMDFYQVMSFTVKFLENENLDNLGLSNAFQAFWTAFEKFDNALKQDQKTGYTKQLLELDSERDNLLIGIRSITEGWVRFTKQQHVEAGERILQLLDKYGTNISRLPQREESATITNLLQDSAETSVAKAIELLGLKVWFEELAKANINFNQLYLLRNEKEAENIIGITRKERNTLQVAFENLGRAIDAYAFVKGEEEYKVLAEKINIEIAKIEQANKSRSTARENKKQKETEKNNDPIQQP